MRKDLDSDGRREPNATTRWVLLLTAVLAVIMIPFVLYGAAMDQWSASLLGTLTERPLLSFGLVVALLASDILLPIPSSIVSAMAGVLLGLAGGAAASFVGMTVGCLVGYGIGRTGGKDLARRLIGARELRRLEMGAERHGDWSIVAARAIPVLAEASALFAGMGSMRLGRFVLLTALSNLGISVAYAAVGAFAMEIQSFVLAVAGAVSLPILASLVLRNREATDPNLIAARTGGPPS